MNTWAWKFDLKYDFEKFKEKVPSKEKFYSLLTGKKCSSKE